MSLRDHLNEVARIEEKRDGHMKEAERLLSSGSATTAIRAHAHAAVALVYQGQVDVLKREWKEMTL
jgi:hypothetical protein